MNAEIVNPDAVVEAPAPAPVNVPVPATLSEIVAELRSLEAALIAVLGKERQEVIEYLRDRLTGVL
jgi:hypothetical protein